MGPSVLVYMLAARLASKSLRLSTSKSSCAASSWQKTLTTRWPFMTSSTWPSTTPISFCCATKLRAEREPSTLVM